MTYNIQYKILNTKNYYNYLKENSSYIKLLNREDKYYEMFNNHVKEAYSLRLPDRLNNAVNTAENVLDIIKLIK